MALVAALVIIVSVLAINMSRICRVRMEPLPERDLNTYLPEDVSTHLWVIPVIQLSWNNPNLKFEAMTTTIMASKSTEEIEKILKNFHFLRDFISNASVTEASNSQDFMAAPDDLRVAW